MDGFVMPVLVAQVEQGLVHGLPGASSIVDRTIPTFSRGELPHFAGINTFMKVSICIYLLYSTS